MYTLVRRYYRYQLLLRNNDRSTFLKYELYIVSLLYLIRQRLRKYVHRFTFYLNFESKQEIFKYDLLHAVR